jgi:hypothetical protein
MALVIWGLLNKQVGGEVYTSRAFHTDTKELAKHSQGVSGGSSDQDHAFARPVPPRSNPAGQSRPARGGLRLVSY